MADNKSWKMLVFLWIDVASTLGFTHVDEVQI